MKTFSYAKTGGDGHLESTQKKSRHLMDKSQSNKPFKPCFMSNCSPYVPMLNLLYYGGFNLEFLIYTQKNPVIILVV